ncbi:MAG: cupin domain-containing protein [Planctomycetales bacterium]|nr:cupin domain-containing protein [Planctomycetales bacterium]
MDQAFNAGQLIDLHDVGSAAEPKPKLLVSTASMNVLRLVLPAGKVIPEHKAAKEITVQCLIGEVDFITLGETVKMTAGTMLYLQPGQPHSLVSISDAIVLVTKAN